VNLNCSFGRQPRAETPQWALGRAGVSDTSAAGEDVGKTEPLVRSGSLQAKELSTAPLKAWLAVDVRGLACGGSGSSCRRGHARVKRRCFPGLRAWVNSWDRPGLVASCASHAQLRRTSGARAQVRALFAPMVRKEAWNLEPGGLGASAKAARVVCRARASGTIWMLGRYVRGVDPDTLSSASSDSDVFSRGACVCPSAGSRQRSSQRGASQRNNAPCQE